MFTCVFQVIDLENDITKSRSNESVGKTPLIHSGTLLDDDAVMNSANLAKSSAPAPSTNPFDSVTTNPFSGVS